MSTAKLAKSEIWLETWIFVASAIEVSGGILIATGLFTILFCFVFFYLVLAGPGAWSLDALVGSGLISTIP